MSGKEEPRAQRILHSLIPVMASILPLCFAIWYVYGIMGWRNYWCDFGIRLIDLYFLTACMLPIAIVIASGVAGSLYWLLERKLRVAPFNRFFVFLVAPYNLLRRKYCLHQ
jgi:hypothetical protein